MEHIFFSEANQSRFVLHMFVDVKLISEADVWQVLISELCSSGAANRGKVSCRCHLNVPTNDTEICRSHKNVFVKSSHTPNDGHVNVTLKKKKRKKATEMNISFSKEN